MIAHGGPVNSRPRSVPYARLEKHMAKLKLKTLTCCLLLLFIFFLFLDVATFGVMVAVAARGIDYANDDNTCLMENSSVECVLILTLQNSSSVGDMATEQRGEIRGANDIYLNWMAGATACGVVWAVVNTVTLIALSEFIRALYKVEERSHQKKTAAQHAGEAEEEVKIELKKLTASTSSAVEDEPDNGRAEDQTDRGPDNIMMREDTIGGYEEREWLKQRLRHFYPFSVIGLFFSSLSYACALLCLLWGIAISFDHARKVAKDVSAFVVVEILTALLLPICLFVGTILFAIVLDFITVGHLDLRIMIPRFIRDVRLESGEKNDYWVMDDTIYYPLKKKNNRMDHRFCCYSIDRSPATWFLTVITCTGFHLAISIFVDMTLDQQITVNSCSSPLIDRSFDCFNASTLNFVDCETNTQTQLLHCFKFFRFGVETDFVSSISAAYFIFLLTMAVFSHIYFVMRNLLRVKPTRYWGIGFSLLGILLMIGSIVVTLFWIVGYAAANIAELQQINIIHIAQFFMVSNFITTVGLFLLCGKWYEKVVTKVHAAPVKIPLVSYTDTERKYIHEVAARDSWPGHTDN